MTGEPMTEVILWQDAQGYTFAYPASNSGLTMAEIAERTVPENTPWSVVSLELALALTADRRAQDARQGMSLTFAQLLIGLVTEAWITEAEGEAWLTGTLPAPVLSLIASLPTNQQFAAKARAIAPSIVIRTDPLVEALGAAQGKTAEQLDTFFTTYASV